MTTLSYPSLAISVSADFHIIYITPTPASIPAMADRQDGTHEIHVIQDEHMGIARYIATRLSTLKPPMNKVSKPFSALVLLNKQQWLFVIVGSPCLLYPSSR